jgi:signal transduction histidine kinase
MSKVLLDALATLTRNRLLIEAVLRQTDDPAQRATLLAGILRSLWPGSPLYACRFAVAGHSHISVQDEAGNPRPEWTALLRDLLAKDTPGKGEKPTVRLPRRLRFPGQVLAVADVVSEDRDWGVLALAVRGRASVRTIAALLTTCADQLALSLLLEAHNHELKSLAEELSHQASLADAGELARPVMHGFNNYLNVVSLHLAVLEPRIPADLEPELAEIRKQGAEIAALVKHFQQYRQSPPPGLRLVDLNQLVRDTVDKLNHAQTDPGYWPRINLILAPGLAPVPGFAPDLKRLITFLIKNAVSAALAGNGILSVRTEQAGEHVILRVEDTGPMVAPESLAQLFEPGLVERAGKSNLELAACKTLVRRLHGSIQGVARPEGGLAIIVELPLERA